MPVRSPKFVIWAPTYDETSGGSIALHTLCDRLNRLGVDAAIWSQRKPSPKELLTPRGLIKLAVQALKDALRPFDTGPFPRRIAGSSNLTDAIVVYSEIVAGNPLGADNVVRWLLYSPSDDHKSTYGKDELYFFYQERFNDRSINPHADNLLRVTTVHPAYAQTNFGERTGSAFIVRKGQGRRLDQHPPGAIQVDALSHEEKAAVFNKVERFYSYDPYTMYSIYAALCGCVSIVVPEEGVDEEQWRPDASLRLGIAYGESDIQRAIESQPALLEHMYQQRAGEDAMVRALVEKCLEAFYRVPTSTSLSA